MTQQSRVPKSVASSEEPLLKEETLVAKRQESGVAFVPTVAASEETGTENMSDDSLILPKLKVVQGMTADKPDGSSDGDFFNSVSKANFGKEIVFVPIYYWTSRILFEKESLNVICRSFKSIRPDMGFISPVCASCPKSQWGKNNERPECQFTFNYAVVLESQLKTYLEGGFEIPLVFMGHGSNAAEFKKMNSVIKSKALGANKIPMFGMKFKAKTRKETFDVGHAHVVSLEYVGYVNEAEFSVTKELYRKMKEQDKNGISDSETAAQTQQPQQSDTQTL